jgi:hypothetical protein
MSRLNFHAIDKIFYELDWAADRELLERVRVCIEAQRRAGGEALRSQFKPNPNAPEVTEQALQELLQSAHHPSGVATDPDISNCLSFNYKSVQGSVFDAELATLRKQVDAVVSKKIKALFSQEVDVKNSGHFWYPPAGFMGWHTNLRTPGWRLYINYCEEPGKSFFRYRDPETGTIVTAVDKLWNFRIFRITPEKPLWHAIYSDTNRYSLGYKVTLAPRQSWLNRIAKRFAPAAT